MIMILGSVHDDVLYFESVMTDRREEVVMNNYKVQIGKIFNQEVLLVYDVYTSYISAMLTNYLIEKYFVLLIFVVGKCVAFNDDFKPGEIAISKRVIAGDVDQIREANVRLGQLPGFPPNFKSEDEIMNLVASSIEKRSFSKYKIASFISSNTIIDTSNKIVNIETGGYMFGHKNNIVFDCTSVGVCISAYINKVPFVAVKVVERVLNTPANTDSYIKVLQEFSSVGKAIVACIGEISHNDVIKGGENV